MARQESGLPPVPNYSFNPGPAVDSGPAQVALQRNAQEMQQNQQTQSNILRTVQMASELAQSFVEASKMRQQRDALKAYAAFNPNQQVARMEPGATTPTQTSLGQTPEGQSLQHRLFSNVLATNPEAASQAVINQNLPKPPTTLEQMAVASLRAGQPVPSAIIETKKELAKPEAPKSMQTQSVLLDGKPAKVVFDPGKGIYSFNGQSVDATRIRPIPPEMAPGKAESLDLQASNAVNRFVEGELKGRSSGVSLQNLKVDSAIHAKELMEGARNPQTGKIELNQVQLPELAMTLTNLITGSNTSTLEQFRDMKPSTLKGYIAQKASFISGKPLDVSTPDWVDSLGHILDRQGKVSEDLRDNALMGLKQRVHASYPDWYKTHGDEYFKSQFGNSYQKKYLDKPAETAPAAGWITLPNGIKYRVK